MLAGWLYAFLKLLMANQIPCAGTLMFTALGSFFNRISDPEMGEPHQLLAAGRSYELHYRRLILSM